MKNSHEFCNIFGIRNALDNVIAALNTKSSVFYNHTLSPQFNQWDEAIFINISMLFATKYTNNNKKQ